MPKQFTSAHAFKRFQVRGERDGAVVFDGGAPVRTVKTDLLGSIDTVWIGDFSNLTTPGRYRIEADGSDASFPFEIGPDVFGRPLRAVQRWFYYQRAFTAVDAAHARGHGFIERRPTRLLPACGWAGTMQATSRSTARRSIPRCSGCSRPSAISGRPTTTAICRVGQRRAGPPRRGEMGPGMAALGAGRIGRLPQYHLPGPVPRVRHQHAEQRAVVPARRSGHARDGPGGGKPCLCLDGLPRS